MKQKHLLFFSILVVILAAMFFLKKINFSPRVEVAEYENLDFSFDADKVGEVIIAKSDHKEQVRLIKEEGGWILPQHWMVAANKEKLERFIKEISSLEGELRSSSKEVFSDYGISAQEALSITLYDEEGKILLPLLVGMQKPAYGFCFVRKENSNNVYLVNKEIFALLGIYGDPRSAPLTPDSWADLRLMQFESGKINSLQIKRLTDRRVITTVDIKRKFDEEKEQNQWHNALGDLPFSLDARKITGFLNKLLALKAVKAVDPAAAGYGFEKPYLSLTIRDEQKPYTLLVGNTAEGDKQDRYVRIPQGHVYVLAGHLIDELDVDISAFFIDNPLRIGKDNLRSISLTSKRKKVELTKDMIGKNPAYLDKLKKFSVEKVVFDDRYPQALKHHPPYSLKIEKEDGTTLVINGSEGEDGTFVVQIKARPEVFRIKKEVFEGIFNRVDEFNSFSGREGQ